MLFRFLIGVSGCFVSLITQHAFSSPLKQIFPQETLVITGTRTERLLRESPVYTDVVNFQQIERYHARDLKEALQYLPGIQLREIHGKSGYEVWIQGLNADRVLVLVDGMPVSPTTGSSVDVTQLSLLDVERVEVVKGATSALYGSAAMGGVVNMITRPIALGLSLSTAVDAGTYGDQNPSGRAEELSTHHLRASGSVANETWRLRLSADENASDGIDPNPNSWPRPGNEILRQTLDSRLEWYEPLGRGSGYLGLGYFSEQSEARFLDDVDANNRYERHQKDEDLERLRSVAGVQWQHSDGAIWDVDVLWEQQTDDTLKFNNSIGIAYDNRDAEYSIGRINTRLEMPEWANHHLMLGVDFSKEILSQFLDGVSELGDDEKERDGPEIFLQDDWFIGDDWELLIGARYQKDSDFGSHFSPKINLRYQAVRNDTQDLFFRLGWGGGYRVPNLKERYFVFDHSQLGYMVLGNSALKPESSHSFQLGLGASWGPELTLDLNLFYNRLRDLIQTEFSHFDSVAIYSYLNVTKATTQGFEIASRWQANDQWNFNFGYTFLDTTNNESGGELTRRPRQQITAGSEWQVRSNLDISLLLRGQSDELADTEWNIRAPGWVVCDVKLNFHWDSQLKLFAGVDNLFDRQRDFSKGFDFAPVAGRYFYLGLGWQWED